MILAKDHYGAFDPESYRVGVLQGLSMALNSNGEIETMMASSESTRSDSDLDNPASSVSVAEKPKLEPQGDVEDLKSRLFSKVRKTASRGETNIKPQITTETK